MSQLKAALRPPQFMTGSRKGAELMTPRRKKKLKKLIALTRPEWQYRTVPNPVQRRGPSEQWLFKQIWSVKRDRKIHKARLPLAAQQPGIKVIDPNTLFTKPLTTHEKWQVPVPDDHVFGRPLTEQDHPDYKEDFTYEFNPQVQLMEGERQACLLTKTHLINGLPSRILEMMGKIRVADQDELVQRYIFQAHKWDPMQVRLGQQKDENLPIWKFKTEFGITAERFGTTLLYKLLSLCQKLGGDYPDLLHSRRVIRDPYVAAQYNFIDKPIQVSGMTTALVSTNKPLQPCVSQQEVQESASFELPDLFPLAPTVDLYHQHIWRPENNTGWMRSSSHIIPHTLILRDHLEIRAPQTVLTTHKNATAILLCFAHSMAYAKQKYGGDITELPEPITMQCIASDGINFNFFVYQLNTLDFKDTSGIKNFAWVDNNNALFNKILPKRGMLRMTKYQDYDPEVLEKFLAMYIQGADLTKKNILDEAFKEMEQRRDLNTHS